MLKVRVTFIDTPNGRMEKEAFIDNIKESYDVLNESRVYKGRGNSKYSNAYLDIDKKADNNSV